MGMSHRSDRLGPLRASAWHAPLFGCVTLGARMSQHPAISGNSATDAGHAALPPPDLSVMRALARAHVLRGDLAAALLVARQISAAQGGRPDAVDLMIDDALAHGGAPLARAALALATPMIPALQIVQIKARIALAEDDFIAAKAILVMALEHGPDHPALRALLTEVMVAAGTAAETRAVLAHIGQPPVNPPAPGAVIARAQPL